jgi:hypothetical protein
MRKSLLTLLLVSVLASMLLVVFAATYNVSISQPLQWLAEWSSVIVSSVPLPTPYALSWTATWSASLNPWTSIPLSVTPIMVLWSVQVFPPTTFTLTLAPVSLWRAGVVFMFQDYMNKTRMLEFYITPPLTFFPKKTVDGSLAVYTNEPGRFFYNYTGRVVVEGGNATPTEGGYLVNTGVGYTYVYDVAKCLLYVTDPYNWPQSPRKIYFDGVERPANEWFDCLNGKNTKITLEGFKVSKVLINGVEQRSQTSEFYISGSDTYRIQIVTKLISSVTLKSISSERMKDGRVRLTINGTVTDVRYAKPVKEAVVLVSVEGKPSGALTTDSNGNFYGKAITPFIVSPYADRLKVELTVTHPDYEDVQLSQSVPLPVAAAAIPYETILQILPIVAIVVVGSAIAVAVTKKGRKAVQTLVAKRRRILRKEEE